MMIHVVVLLLMKIVFLFSSSSLAVKKLSVREQPREFFYLAGPRYTSYIVNLSRSNGFVSFDG